MTRIQWSLPAVEQLNLIRRLELRVRVFKAVGGLARFPLKGHTPPEVARFSELELPDDLRELVFPRLVRLFYRYDSRRDLVRVLGMVFRSQEVGPDWFGRFLT